MNPDLLELVAVPVGVLESDGLTLRWANRCLFDWVPGLELGRSLAAFYPQFTERRAVRALEKGREADAREALRRGEGARRQVARLGEELASQENDTREVREQVELLHQRLTDARSRHQVLVARLRQTEARRAASKALRGVEKVNLYGEFQRLGERVDRQAAEERAYLRLDDQLSGAEVRRRFEASALDDTVEDRLEALRRELDDGGSVVAETTTVEATLETTMEVGADPGATSPPG